MGKRYELFTLDQKDDVVCTAVIAAKKYPSPENTYLSVDHYG